MDKQEVFNQYRDHLLSARQSSFEQFDKAVLTLSSGGLGLSLAFIKDIVPPAHLVCFPLLIISWTLFGICILSTLTSFVLSQYAVDRQLDYAEEYYINNKPEYFNKKNAVADATKVSNIVSGGAFFVAVLLTIVFTSINLRQEGIRMADQENNKKVPIQEGYVPPNMQKDTGVDGIKGYVPGKMPKAPPASDQSGSTQTPTPTETPKDTGDKK